MDYLVKPVVPEFVRSKVAVFVELAKKNELLRRQAELLRQSEQEARSWPRPGPSWCGTWSTRIGSWRASATLCRTTCGPPSAGSRASAGRFWRVRASGWTRRAARYLDRVREASQQMAQLIDDVLYLSRVTRAEMREQDVDLSAVADAGARAGCRRASRIGGWR